MTKANGILSIDVGGTHTRLGLFDGQDNKELVEKRVFPTNQNLETWLENTFQSTQELLNGRDIIGIGACFPGLLDDQGTLKKSNNLSGWENQPMKKILEEQFDCGVEVPHDVAAAAIGECVSVKKESHDEYVYIAWGTGIGGAALKRLGTQIYLLSFQPGHISLDWKGRVCTCGQVGCPEAYIGGNIIQEYFGDEDYCKVLDTHSGWEVTVPKLFVNNSTGRIGLVGYWDTVAFDEFAGKAKKANRALVDILKNYMANKTFSRGIETIGAEASMAYVGNTAHNVEYMLMHTNFFEELPEQYYDSAFLDRLHFYIPGWEVEVLRDEMFSNGYGFVLDYLAEILRKQRSYNYANRYEDFFSLSRNMSTRDKDGINKTFSGLFKILFPQGSANKEDIEMILKFAMEGRKRVKDQLVRIDTTFPDYSFSYSTIGSEQELDIKTSEEEQYPQHYYTTPTPPGKEKPSASSPAVEIPNLSEEELLIQQGESDELEFKATLRWNLETQRSERRVENGVLKTVVAFLNTAGGTLLDGVRDDGKIMGLAIEKFEDDDELLVFFSNMLNDRIGKQYAEFIKFYLKKINGLTILRVDCTPSSTATFLQDKSAQIFYIRNGPATAKLNPKEMLEYTKKHFR